LGRAFADHPDERLAAGYFLLLVLDRAARSPRKGRLASRLVGARLYSEFV